MSSAQDEEVAQLYIFENVERVARFYIHLNEIKEQFYLDDDSRIRDKLSFIQSYEECLEGILKMLIEFSNVVKRNGADIDAVIVQLAGVSLTINKLHKDWLVHLPRPSEPIELRRFCRVIEKQALIITENNYSQISIYVNEEIGESTYASDPLQQFKLEEINPSLDYFNRFFVESGGRPIDLFESIENNSEPSTIHITIPRIDANNPCHWPTLMHEVAHKMLKADFFDNRSIVEDFEASLNETMLRDVKELGQMINMESWLTECWCDLFASITIGHSFWFSQYASFLSSAVISSDNKNYPPALFRLNLIEKVLTHRFSHNIFEVNTSNVVTLSESLLKKLDGNNTFTFYGNGLVRKTFLYFREYFLQHFFRLKDNQLEVGSPQLNDKIQMIVKYVTEINPTTINELIVALKAGLPIPSARNVQALVYREQATTIQEIFLAAWSFRNSDFRKMIISGLGTLRDALLRGEDFRDSYKEIIEKEFRRFDQSILRSIQVSEWVALLQDTSTSLQAPLNDAITDDFAPKGILTDTEIEKLIFSGEIKIIPIINLERQLGTTSFDIRLGTSFQVYFPNQYGVIDFIQKQTIKNAASNSKKINLDYLESITISPGQFILGHSMEYIKLSDYISADLEGRSSFARLGIEIHMTAGFIDPGFEGVLTFEIFNAGPNPVKLYPGMRIGQLRFININRPRKSYGSLHTAKYRGLLEHHNSLQGKDYEVERIRDEQEKEKEKEKQKRNGNSKINSV